MNSLEQSILPWGENMSIPSSCSLIPPILFYTNSFTNDDDGGDNDDDDAILCYQIGTILSTDFYACMYVTA